MLHRGPSCHHTVFVFTATENHKVTSIIMMKEGYERTQSMERLIISDYSNKPHKGRTNKEMYI